jgi:hypothetical protein
MDFHEAGMSDTIMPGSLFKEYMFGTYLIKITDKDDNETYSVPLKDGLNERLNNTHFTTTNYYISGYKFVDLDNVERVFEHLRMISVPLYYREIEIPDDAQVSVGTIDFSSDKIILGERRSINDLQIWDDPTFIEYTRQEIRKKNYTARKIFSFVSKHFSEDELEVLVDNDSYLIEYIADASEKLQLMAIRKSPFCYKFIKNPTEKVTIEALEKEDVFYSVPNKTEAVCIKSVSKRPTSINQMSYEQQTVKVCEECLKRDGMLLQHIKREKTEDLCIIAVKENPNALYQVPVMSRTYKVYFEAVSRNGSLLCEVPCGLQDENMIEAAVRNKGSAIKHAKNVTDRIRGIAFESDPEFVTDIENLSDESILKAIKSKPIYILKILQPTYQMWLTAVEADGRLLSHISKEIQEIDDYYIIRRAVKNCGCALKHASFVDQSIIDDAINQDSKAIVHVENPTEEQCMRIMKKDFNNYKLLKNPSEEVSVYLIQNRPNSIGLVKNMTKKIALAAIGKNGYYYTQLPQFLKDDIEVQHIAVQVWPYAFKHMSNPSDELCKIYVSYRPELYYDIPAKQQTEELSLMALNATKSAYCHIKNKTAKICDQAYEKYPELFHELPIKSAEMCDKAINFNPVNIRYVPKIYLTEVLILKAVTLDPMVLEHIHEQYQTEKVVTHAINKNPHVLKYVKNKTDNFLKLAITLDPSVLKLLDYQPPVLVKLALRMNPAVYEYVKKPTIEDTLSSIQRRAECMKDVSDQMTEVCATAAILNPDCLQYVKDQNVRENIQKWIERMASL